MKHLLALILIFLGSLYGNAQDLRIVKDNVNCTYGIKDSTGNWVIQPLYILIRRYNTGYFLVKDALGDGLLSPSGKWIVPCKYDQIEVARPFYSWQLLADQRYFNKSDLPNDDFILEVHLGERKSLLNSRGETIVEMAKNDTYVFDGQANILILASSYKTTTYIDTAGTILIDRMPGFIAPFGARTYSLNGDYWTVNSPYLMHGNVRVISRDGEVLKDLKVESALLLTNIYAASDERNRIAFENDDYYGVMTLSGDTIIPPNYRRKESLSAPESSYGSWVIYDKDDRAGIMRADGKVILEPTYDEITLIQSIYSLTGDTWQIKQDGKIGIMDSSGKLIIPIEYDVIYPVQTNPKNYLAQKGLSWTYLRAENAYAPQEFYDALTSIYNHYNHSHGSFQGFITERDGKYGFLNPDGSIRVDCVYSSHFKREYSEDYVFFSKGKELIQYVFRNNAIHEIKWKPFIIDGPVHIYTDSVKHKLFYFSKSKNCFTGYDNNYSEIEENGNLFLILNLSKEQWNIYSKITKRRLPLKNIQEIQAMSDDRYRIQTKSHRTGVLDSQGKIVIDTLYFELNENRNSSDLWALKGGSSQVQKWILLDSIGRQVIPNLFDSSFELNSGNQLVSQNGKIGLIDTKTLRWKIRPDQPCLWKMVHDNYYIATGIGKTGIIRSDGTYVILPVYDSIVLFYSNCHPNRDCSGTIAEIRWIAYDQGEAFLVDQDGNVLGGQSSIQELKKAILFDDSEIPSIPNVIGSFPVIDYSPSLDVTNKLTEAQKRTARRELWTNPVLKTIVFDSIYAHWKISTIPVKNRYIYPSITLVGVTQQPSLEVQKVMKICNCAQIATFSTLTSGYRLEAKGDNFASIGVIITKRDYYMGGDWGIVGQHIRPIEKVYNLVYTNGTAKSIQLSDIFPSDSVLMSEFITSLKKRDDLKLDCSSLEMMIEMIGGKFTLGTDGVRLHLSQTNINSYGVSEPVTLLIPIENLDNHAESKWIVPILRTFD